MSSVKYENRQLLDMATWPDLREKFTDIIKLVMPGRELSSQFKWEIFTISSLAGGCHHCQSHGAFGLHLMGVSTQRIRDIWIFEQSEEFSEEEKIVFAFVRDSAQIPNKLGAAHFETLRNFYTDPQIVEVLAVTSVAAWLNRWNDSIAVVTDADSITWAKENLSDLGWDGAKHSGDAHEQKKGHPVKMGVLPAK